MTPDESRLARRWAARRTANAHESVQAAPDDPGMLTTGMSVLSNYEDAIYASCRHALVPAGQTQVSESVHLVEATRLHADVRLLRLEVLDLIEASVMARDVERQ